LLHGWVDDRLTESALRKMASRAGVPKQRASQPKVPRRRPSQEGRKAALGQRERNRRWGMTAARLELRRRWNGEDD
jgi:hypothetical protein